MRKTIAIVVILFSGLCLKAQANLDSLYKVWQDGTQSDSIRINAYNTYIMSGFLFSNPDTAIILAQNLLQFGEVEQNSKAIASAYLIMGAYHSVKPDPDQIEALNYSQKSLKIAKEIGDKQQMAKALLFIGNINRAQGKLLMALNNYKNSLIISNEIGDKQQIANAVSNIGVIYKERGKLPQAIVYYQQGLKIAKEIGDKNGIAQTLNNIGVIYIEQKDFPQALDYYQRSLKISEETGDEKGIARTLNNIGVIYIEQKDFPLALDYYQRSLKISKEIGDLDGIAVSYSGIAGFYLNEENYPMALEYYSRSLNLYEEVGDKNRIAIALNSVGNINTIVGKYQEAISYCKKSLELSEELGILQLQKNASKNLYNTYKLMSEGNQALVYLEKIQVIDDSLDAQETNKKLQQMEFSKQVFADSIAQVEKDRLVEEVHQEEVAKKNKTRNMLAGAGLFVLFLAGGIYSRLRYVKKSKAIIEEEKDRSNNLLLNILPRDIAEELKIHGKSEARDFDMVSILFTDFKGFTAVSAKLSAADLVHEINACFEAFDGICEKYAVEKIKTIGDAYMAAGGLPILSDESVKNTILAALEMQDFMGKRKAEMDAAGKSAFQMRVGIHTGPVVAGIVGVKKFQYDIWGDTVNTASRMESSGEVEKVNISQATYEILKDDTDFRFESRGKIQAKGKGEIEMYFVLKT